MGAGSERATFLVPEGALKLSFDPSGCSSSRNELRIWGEAPVRIRRHLVPVLEAEEDGRWLLMERVWTAGWGASIDPDVFALLTSCGIVDLSPQNLARDGRVLDYGYLWNAQAWERCVDRG